MINNQGLLFIAYYLLPDEGSNPNIQSQNLTYYHYTIGQKMGLQI